MYNWKLFRNRRSYKCKCWMTDDCAPCPDPPWTWNCFKKDDKKVRDDQQIFLLDHDGNYLGMFHPYK